MQKEEKFKVSLDANAQIIKFNETAEKISGYTKDEVIGKNWFKIFIDDDTLVDILQVFYDLFYGKDMYWEYTNNIVCKDGGYKKIKWQNNIIKDDDNKPILIDSSGIFID